MSQSGDLVDSSPPLCSCFTGLKWMMLSTVLLCSLSCTLLLVLPLLPDVAVLTTSSTDSSLQKYCQVGRALER